MRIRSTKPEFWKSRRIASVSWDARLVLKGLESYVDDNGVGIDDIELIVTDVFPRDMFAKGSETVARVSEAITELHQAGLVHRYTTKSDHLLYISWWESIQRIDKPGKGRNPRPDGTWNYRDSEIREGVASPPETLAPGTGEQGNRGTEEQRNRGTEEKKARPPVQTEPHSDEPAPTPAAAATRGADLVRANIPSGHPSATLTALRIQASELLHTGTDPDVIAEALRLWCDKPGVGNGRTSVASLCSEVIKARNAPRNGKPHKLRELADLAAEVRAAEVLEMETTTRKAIR